MCLCEVLGPDGTVGAGCQRGLDVFPLPPFEAKIGDTDLWAFLGLHCVLFGC